MPTHFQGSHTEVLALNTFIKLTRSVESVLSRLNQGGTLGNLTISQFGVLESLYHLRPMCQAEIGSKLLRSGGNITLVIDNLEKQGLVIREQDPQDRRRTIISLTQAGEKLISQIFPNHLKAIVSEMNILRPEEQAQLGELCRKLGLQENSRK